jgi:ADP-ribose pyrophosphatase YjhB (NUDIX family)
MKIKNHIGVYAIILNKAGNAMLVIKKARGPYTGMLDLPGGSLEDNETLDVALEREILEETGCAMTSCRQLGTERVFFEATDPQTGEPVRWQHIGILYHATTNDEPTVESDGLDSNGTAWLSLADLMTSNTTPLVKLAIKAYDAL